MLCGARISPVADGLWPMVDVCRQDTPVASVKRGEDGDVQKEYNRQREHLERNVEALKGSIDKVPCCVVSCLEPVHVIRFFVQQCPVALH